MIFHEFFPFASIFIEIIRFSDTTNSSLEIELIYIDSSCEYLLLHFGKTSSILPSDHLSFISSYLNKDNSFSNNAKFLRFIMKKLGLQRTIQLILSAETSQNCDNETLFQRFIDELIKRKLLSIDEMQEFLVKNSSVLTPAEVYKKSMLFSFENKEENFSFAGENKENSNNFIQKDSPIFNDKISKRYENDDEKLNRKSIEKLIAKTSEKHVEKINENIIEKIIENPEEILLKKTKEKEAEKVHFSHKFHDIINRNNAKSSVITHKSEELPSFYSGKLFEASPKSNFLDNLFENPDENYIFSRKMVKSWSEKFENFEKINRDLCEEGSFDEERTESRSYH